MTAALVAGLLIVVGLVGTVVPVLPGAVLVGVATAGWGVYTNSPTGWVVAVLAIVVTIAGTVLSLVVPSRRMQGDVPRSTLLAGVAGAVAGLVLPGFGPLVGFIVGIALWQIWLHRGLRGAWPATWATLSAIGLSVLVEALTAIAVASIWVVGLVVQSAT